MSDQPPFVQANLRRIGRLTRPVADLARAEQFYCGALGFQVRDRGIFLRLALGAQQVALRRVDPASLPTQAAANDPSFQHLAIVVRDIDAAWRQVTAAGQGVPISQTGPQHLPNGIAAWKFRDPDGHPLELLWFPDGQGRPQWHRPGAPLFQGIDHSAITIRNTDTSLRFYRDLLGLRISSRGLNQGAPQQALDNVTAPVVRITQLRPAEPKAPRLELLDYLSPALTPAPNPGFAPSRDQLTLHLRCMTAVHRGLALTSGEGPSLTVHDPDGHALLLKAPRPLPPASPPPRWRSADAPRTR